MPSRGAPRRGREANTGLAGACREGQTAHTTLWLTLLGVIGTIIIVSSASLAILFTTRSQVAGVWKENYLGEKAKREAVEAELQIQRELKHQALNDLAIIKLKTDLAPVLEAIGKGQVKMDVIDAHVEEIEQRMFELEEQRRLRHEKNIDDL